MEKFLLLVINDSEVYHNRHEHCVSFCMNNITLHMWELVFLGVDIELISEDLMYNVQTEIIYKTLDMLAILLSKNCRVLQKWMDTYNLYSFS